MALTIKYLLLQKAELSYEVAIRGETPSENVEGLRRQITKLIQLYPADDILDSVLSLDRDISGCNDTLEKIKVNLESLRTNYSEPLCSRITSWLNHLHYRIQRMQKPEKPDEVNAVAKIQKIYDIYNNSIESLSKSKEPKASTSGKGEDSHDKTDYPGINISVDCKHDVITDLSKFSYNGNTCVRSFIQRIEEFRISKSVPESKMMKSAGGIFTDGALHWYRKYKNIVTSWSTLLILLRESFDIPDYDYRMASEIRDRTQGEHETITVYLAVMDGMFSRLGQPMSEEAKLEVLLHNIRPCYIDTIASNPNISTIEELLTVCKNYERIKAFSTNYREPPTRSSNMLAPEFCYTAQRRRDEKPFNNYYGNGNTARDNSRYRTSEISAAPVSAPYCARCRVNTHSMRDCTAERTIICFGCGEKGIRKPDCPKCRNKTKDQSSSSKN